MRKSLILSSGVPADKHKHSHIYGDTLVSLLIFDNHAVIMYLCVCVCLYHLGHWWCPAVICLKSTCSSVSLHTQSKRPVYDSENRKQWRSKTLHCVLILLCTHTAVYSHCTEVFSFLDFKMSKLSRLTTLNYISYLFLITPKSFWILSLK